jgi:hypothetical protein
MKMQFDAEVNDWKSDLDREKNVQSDESSSCRLHFPCHYLCTYFHHAVIGALSSVNLVFMMRLLIMIVL